MIESLRSVLERLDKAGGLLHITREVDARHVSALLVKADRPVLFERGRGFDFPGVGGLYWTRERLAGRVGWPEGGPGLPFPGGIGAMGEPFLVADAPCQQVVLKGDDVD